MRNLKESDHVYLPYASKALQCSFCSVYKLLRPSLLHPTSSLIMKESPQECYAKLHAADVRLLGRGRIPLIPFILHCTHAQREREREGGRERKRERALRESPWGLLFWWALNAYTDSCRHKCVWCWENLLLNIKTTQKAHQICISPRCSGVPPDFNRTCVGFLSFCTFEVPSLGFFCASDIWTPVITVISTLFRYMIFIWASLF